MSSGTGAANAVAVGDFSVGKLPSGEVYELSALDKLSLQVAERVLGSPAGLIDSGLRERLGELYSAVEVDPSNAPRLHDLLMSCGLITAADLARLSPDGDVKIVPHATGLIYMSEQEGVSLFIPSSLGLCAGGRGVVGRLFGSAINLAAYAGRERELTSLIRLGKVVIEHPLMAKSDEAFEMFVKLIHDKFPEFISGLEPLPKREATSSVELGAPFRYLKPGQRELLALKAANAGELSVDILEAMRGFDRNHPVWGDLERLEGLAMKAYMEGALSDGEVSALLIIAATRFETWSRVELLEPDSPKWRAAVKGSCISGATDTPIDYMRRVSEGDKEALLGMVLRAGEGLSPVENVLIRVRRMGDDGWEDLAGVLRELGGTDTYLLPSPTLYDNINALVFGDNVQRHKGPFGYTLKMPEWTDEVQRPISCPIVGAHYGSVHELPSVSASGIHLHDTLHLLAGSLIDGDLRKEVMEFARFLDGKRAEETDPEKLEVLRTACALIADEPQQFMTPLKEDPRVSLEKLGSMEVFYALMAKSADQYGVRAEFDEWRAAKGRK